MYRNSVNSCTFIYKRSAKIFHSLDISKTLDSQTTMTQSEEYATGARTLPGSSLSNFLIFGENIETSVSCEPIRTKMKTVLKHLSSVPKSIWHQPRSTHQFHSQFYGWVDADAKKIKKLNYIKGGTQGWNINFIKIFFHSFINGGTQE